MKYTGIFLNPKGPVTDQELMDKYWGEIEGRLRANGATEEDQKKVLQESLAAKFHLMSPSSGSKLFTYKELDVLIENGSKEGSGVSSEAMREYRTAFRALDLALDRLERGETAFGAFEPSPYQPCRVLDSKDLKGLSTPNSKLLGFTFP